MATITRRTKTVLTWSEVSEWVKSGEAAKKLSVGDEIRETLTTGEKIITVVAGIDVYAEQQVVFSFKNCLKVSRYMNPHSTNRGGWAGCDMRRYLNADIFETLPEDLRNIITPRAFNAECTDKLWLFSEHEIFGKNVYGEDHGDKHIPYYKNPINRCKGLGEGCSAYLWWLRSPYAASTAGFCIVYSNGTASYSYASNSYGVAAGFCI